MGMNEFKNKLILHDDTYEGGLFARVPNYRKDGSAFILTDGIEDDLLVTEYTTSKDIRHGRYTRQVEISTRPYMTEIRFTANAQEQAYSFDVYVKAVIQVVNPTTFYRNRNIDVDAYFYKLFSIDVKQITRRYSILDYEGLDDELTKKLSAYNNIDADTGFSYQVSVVDAEPSKEALEFVERASKQQLESALQQQAIKLSTTLTNTYAEAVLSEVVEGKLTLQEALLRIEQHDDALFDKRVDKANTLTEKGYINERQAGVFVLSNTKSITKSLTPESEAKALTPAQDDSDLDQFFPGSD